MKKFYLILLTSLICATHAFSQNPWKQISAVPGKARVQKDKLPLVQPKLFQLNTDVLRARLKGAPLRKGRIFSSNVVSFPNEEGILENFSVVESSNMDPALAARYPDIKSYVGKGIENPAQRIYFSVSPLGVKSMLIRPDKETVFIEPYTEDKQAYVTYTVSDELKALTPIECHVVEAAEKSIKVPEPIEKKLTITSPATLANRPNADDGILRTYRLAITCNAEYTQYFGGTIAGAIAGMNATLTRVNGIFEKDFGVHLNLIADNDKIIYLDPATDPYGASSSMDEGAHVVDREIGRDNYDLYHLFFRGAGGGIAALRSVCKESVFGGFSPDWVPEGFAFDISLVAHEIGHQFGARHVFSFQSSDGGGYTSAQVEPGPGTSIMSYGADGSIQVPGQPLYAAYFNAMSIEEVMSYVKTLGCSVNTPTENAIPIVTAGLDYTIPKSTPFLLQGHASDADGDPLTYSWEQQDPAISATNTPISTSTTGPMFGGVSPGAVPYRYFPSSFSVANPTNSGTRWEVLPSVTRLMNFRFTVRDNHAGGPANNSDDVVVTVNDAFGPFVVTSPNTLVTWPMGSVQTVTWNVANTTAAPVSCENVRISLSTDGGMTFPLVLVGSTPNDGSQSITVPSIPTVAARIKVEAIGNIFYDISDVNFYITNTGVFEINAEVIPLGYGTISPYGLTKVLGGSSQTYTITPIENYSVREVFVDGVSKGSVSKYTFTNVNAPHTINATFTNTGCTAQPPANITGATFNLCGVQEVTYEADAVSGATAYEWVLPEGFTLVSGQGTRTVVIKTPASFTTAELRVRTTSTCGISPYVTQLINGAPGDLSEAITGPSEIDADGALYSYSLPSTAGLAYTWAADGGTVEDGQNTNSVSIKSAGINGYVSATVQNACGTAPPARKYVTVKPAIICEAPKLYTAVHDVVCSGAKTGAIDFDAVDGSGPFTYQWTGPGGFVSTEKSLSGLAAGNYTVTLTGQNGCTFVQAYSIWQPETPLVVSLSAGTIECVNGTTYVSVTASGGAGEYPTGTGFFHDQTAGTKTYTVTDLHGCSISKTIVIPDGTLQAPATPAAISGPTVDLCGGKEATYLTNPVSGASAYIWELPAGLEYVEGGGTNTVTASISATFTTGTLKVAAVNSCGLSSQVSLVISGAPGDLSQEITGPSEVLAGSINVYSLPSTPGYSYSWAADGSTVEDGGNSASASIKAGTTDGYVRVTVNNACGTAPVAKKYFTVKPVDVCTPPNLSASLTNVGCFGAKTGAINLTATGGSSPYAYQWTGPDGFVSAEEDLTSVTPGSYTVIATATGGCTATATYSVTQPVSALNIVVTAGTLGCNDITTSVTVTANGGTAPYTGTGVLTEQTAGSHTYTVTDANGCSISKTILISATGSGNATAVPAAITGEVNHLCGGQNITYTASAVTGATSYEWMLPTAFTIVSGQGTATVTIKTPPTFTTAEIRVRAVALCEKSSYRTLIIHEAPANPGEDITGPSAVIAGSVNVYSLPSITGFSYTWEAEGGEVVEGGNSASVRIRAGDTNGNITAKVKNTCGNEIILKKDFTVESQSFFRVAPNPVKDRTTIAFSALQANIRYEVRVIDRYGRVLLTRTGQTVEGINTFQLNLAQYTAGIYMVTLLTDNKISNRKIFKGN